MRNLLVFNVLLILLTLTSYAQKADDIIGK